jgi:hypothetical protein
MTQRPQLDDAIGRSAMAKAMWRSVLAILQALVTLYVRRRVLSGRRERAPK